MVGKLRQDEHKYNAEDLPRQRLTLFPKRSSRCLLGEYGKSKCYVYTREETEREGVERKERERERGF